MDEKRMPLAEHLTELRSRLVVCLVASLALMIVAYFYCPDVFFPILRAPLDAASGRSADNPFVIETPLFRLMGDCRPDESQTQLHVLSVTEAFITRLKVSLVVGILLALPLIVYEAWAFVAAGLTPRERRAIGLYAPASLLLFVAGAALAYFVVLPIGIVFLLSHGQELGLEAMLRLKEYLPFVLWLLLGFGLIFQMPLIALFLTKLGLVNPGMLARSRRYAVLVIFVAAACLTPPDVFTQVAMAVPMLLLYEFSILLSRLAVKKKPAGEGPF